MTAELYSEGLDNFLYQHYSSEEDKRHARSEQYLQKTKLSREIKKMVKKKNGIFYSEQAFNQTPKWKISEDSSFDGCAWNIRKNDDGLVIGQGVVVESLPNGSVFVRGAPNVTKLLLFKEWQNNRDVLFRAFKEAIEKPMTVVF